MAKLIAVCVVAACLTVALAGDSNSDARNKQADDKLSDRQWITRVEEIERKEEKTVEDWNALETGYSRILLSESSQLNADQAHDLLEKLQEVLKHSKKERRDFLHPVGYYLQFRRVMDCTKESSIEDRESDLYMFATKLSVRNYLTDSISKYLEHCKYEEMFKHAISHVDQDGTKHWNWIKYPTLYDYWKKKVGPQGNRYVQTDSNWIIRLVKHISSLQERIDCRDKDLRNSLIYNVVKSKLYHPELYTLVNAYFNKYLSACGLEDRFKKAMTDCGSVPKGGDSSFNYYLMGEYWKQASKNKPMNKGDDYLEDRLKSPAIIVVDSLVGPSQIDASHCSEEYKHYFATYLYDTEKNGYTKLNKCLKKGSIRHSQVCQAHFIAKAENFKNKQQDAWSRIEKFKAAMDQLGDVGMFKTMHSNGVWGNRHGLEVNNLETDLEQPCKEFYDTMKPSKEAIDLKTIWNSRIEEFYDTFGYCARLLGRYDEF